MLKQAFWLLILPLQALAGQGHSNDHNQEVIGQVIQPIPQQIEIDKAVAKLGWTLFRDPNLSSNRSISCESCHNLQTNGAEPTRVSTGVNGQGLRNSLTVFNAALNYRFFWDGRVNSLEDQIDGPVANPVEMDSSWQEIEQYVSRSSRYQALFDSIDNFDINSNNIRYALAEFMRGLQTPNAPFDRYLNGDEHAINNQEKRGWQTFQQVGCVQCHQGPNVGGNMIQKFGYFTELNTSEDTGKHLVTENTLDKFYFRVASLRNVAQTSPYFHDGRTQSLTQAIQIMAQGQLGITMDDDTIADIEAFLHTLTAPRPALLEEFENE
ncbi:cytochrome-c peroxidase [Vibrio rhodolitus]|uniref:cytochrome-c peroxidase n=1 Tax=Vibrio rhodolitus TaxID=2231649 RepID=UPI000E0C4471|nr:cytochrome c peroxidase [Vibrio rhodolitus]